MKETDDNVNYDKILRRNNVKHQKEYREDFSDYSDIEEKKRCKQYEF